MKYFTIALPTLFAAQVFAAPVPGGENDAAASVDQHLGVSIAYIGGLKEKREEEGATVDEHLSQEFYIGLKAKREEDSVDRHLGPSIAYIGGLKEKREATAEN